VSIQQTIIKGIKEQLFFNNYLVLPDFGGFVLKSNASHFSASGGLLLPPSKTVSFNSQLKQNDGILATWLQSTLHCSAHEALNHLHDFSEFCTGILNARRRLSLDGIGFFYLDFENNICFEPQQDSNFLTKSFGLGPVLLTEIEPEISEVKKETVFVDRTLHVQEKSFSSAKPKRNYGKLVSPVLLSILITGLLTLLIINSRISGELRSSLFGENNKGAYTPLNYGELTLATIENRNMAYVADANGIATIDLENGKRVAVKAVENKFNSRYLNSSKPISRINSSGLKTFEIVLGCFTVLENANRMANKLAFEQISASVSGKNHKGMYVVSSGAFASKEEALRQLVKLKTGFPHAWIKKVE
jgi:hypothetical protein